MEHIQKGRQKYLQKHKHMNAANQNLNDNKYKVGKKRKYCKKM